MVLASAGATTIAFVLSAGKQTRIDGLVEPDVVDAVRLVVNDQWINGTGIMSFAPNELLVKVADDVQEIVMDDSRV